ncbi:MAG TPA: bifunctional isocitrate dehydrogenase kinase/phosphatase [Burkholderiales bacterium]|nr:bifunctional isocitrate dehydrogenase kinase/phosphatase [Burkholderiales bacterium]
MILPKGENPVAVAIAEALLDGFDKHYRLFREASREAKERFESGDWAAQQRAVRDRIAFYDQRVRESAERLHGEFGAKFLDENTWAQAKLLYIGLLTNHKQPELAETFFSSVFCRVMDRTYFHNEFIFFRPAVSTEYIESDPPAYRTYYPLRHGWHETLRRVFADFDWRCPFADLGRDIGCALDAARQGFGGELRPEPNCQIQVLASAFYRNKGAYVCGKLINGDREHAFVVPVLHDGDGRLCLDTFLADPFDIGRVFSLNRAYFMVDMEVPSAYVQFLRTLMPNKPRAELYTMLGLGKQGKTMFYRELTHHLRHSDDEFVIAPGVRGLVMVVFTLPSFPYVFKVIRDEIVPPKDTDRETVKAKYLLVKQHDRVGRMADTHEFSKVALPKARFSAALLEELRGACSSIVEENDLEVVIAHLYIERRMTPLNLYLDRADDERLESVARDYGNAIRELAYANIFPGDMLMKNFGVTRLGRVVFYDYDEIEYLTNCNFRWIPEAPNPELEMSDEVWYRVAKNDVFPEEFATFLLTNHTVRSAFMKHHADLLRPDFWRATQARLAAGRFEDFYPYPEAIRFCNTHPAPALQSAAVAA